MDYVVICRYMYNGAWETRQREFESEDAAMYWANKMYGGDRKEVCVCVYKQIALMN